jgi:hypothetical protein
LPTYKRMRENLGKLEIKYLELLRMKKKSDRLFFCTRF